MPTTLDHTKVGQGSFYAWQLVRWDEAKEDTVVIASGEVRASGPGDGNMGAKREAKEALAAQSLDVANLHIEIRRGHYEAAVLSDDTVTVHDADFIQDECWICTGWPQGVEGIAWETESF